MRNYFLKTFTICFLMLVGTLTTYAQDYLPREEAINVVASEYTSVSIALEEWAGPKTMDYLKYVAKKQILVEMIAGFKQGLTTEEVVDIASSPIVKNEMQRVKPMFPDSNGKVGSNWINEDIISLLHK